MMAASEFTIGRLQMHWKGTYSASHIPDANSMKYHVVTTQEIGEDKNAALFHSAIPTTWFDSSGKYFVHPPKDFVVCKKTPIEWPNLTFYRHSSPCMSWVEYDVFQIETAGCSRDHKGAFRILKQIRDNIGKEMWSDPERPLGTGKRRKTMTDKVAGISKKRKKSTPTTNDLETIKEHHQLGDDLVRAETAVVQNTTNDLETIKEKHQLGDDLERAETAAVQNTTIDLETIKEQHQLGNGLGNAETAAVQNNLIVEQQEQSRPVQSIETGGFWEDTPTPLNNNVAVNILSEVLQEELSSQDQRTFQDISTPKLPPNPTGRDQVKRVLTDQQSCPFDKVNDDVQEDSYLLQPTNPIHTVEPEPVPSSSTSTTPHRGNHYSEAVDSYFNLEERVKSLESGKIEKEDMIRIFKEGIRQVLSAIQNQGNAEKKVVTAAAYHKACVEKNFSTLPCTELAKIVAVNTALLDVSLSVSLACVLAMEFRASSSQQEFMTNVFVRLISPRLCNGFQWKTGGRGTDKRQGLSCFINIITVIGVALRIFRRSKNEMDAVPLQTLIYLIQTARKLGAKKDTGDESTAAPVPVVHESEVTLLEIDLSIDEIMAAADNFKIPTCRNAL